jgi:soluble lytic murein transglycosylase-like protein
VKLVQAFFFLLATAGSLSAQHSRAEAEYYAAAYAAHYGVPLVLVRAVIEQESRWQICARSQKGAVGLMQLMPETARRLGVRDRCDPSQNISGGVRYLAWLMNKFHGDLRLVTAAYYAGEHIVESRGLSYRNPDVVAYVSTLCRRMSAQNNPCTINTKTQRRN